MSKKILNRCRYTVVLSTHYWFYYILAIYLIVTTSFSFSGNLNWHDEQRLGAALLLLLLFLGWGCAQIHSRLQGIFFSFIPSSVIASLIFFAFLGAISAAMSQFPRWAFLEVAWLLALMAGILFIANLRFDAGEVFDRIVFAIVVASCLLYLLNFFAVYATLFAGIPLIAWDMFHGFSNPRFFGQFQTMTLPFLALLVFYAKTIMHKIGAFALLGAWWMLSFASGTRGTWLSMLVALVMVSIVGKTAGRLWTRLQIYGVVIGLALYSFLFYVVPDLLGTKGLLINRLPNITGLSLRDVLWSRAWDMILTNPLLGVGPMNFATQPNGIGAHPHNSVLQIAAEWGIPALSLAGGVILLGFFRLAQYLGKYEQQVSSQIMLPIALFGALIAAATQSLVDGIIVMPYSQILLILLYGWSIGWYYTSGSQVSTVRACSFRIIGMALTSVLLLVVIACTAFPEAMHLQQREQEFKMKHGDYFLPRFWRQGWIDQ